MFVGNDHVNNRDAHILGVYRIDSSPVLLGPVSEVIIVLPDAAEEIIGLVLLHLLIIVCKIAPQTIDCLGCATLIELVFEPVLDLSLMTLCRSLSLLDPEVLNVIGHIIHEGEEVSSVIFAPNFFAIGPLDPFVTKIQSCPVKLEPAVDEVSRLDAFVGFVESVNGAEIFFDPVFGWNVLLAPVLDQESAHFVFL